MTNGIYRQTRLQQSNIQCDYDAIARGIYKMIPENYKAALAFGMCPAPFMELAEKEFKRKIVVSSMKRTGQTINEKEIEFGISLLNKDLVNEFNKELALALLREAKRNNALVV